MRTVLVSGVTFYTRKSKKDDSPQTYAMDIAKECGNQVIVKYGDYAFGSVYNYDTLANMIDKTPYKDRMFHEILQDKQHCFTDIDGEFSEMLEKTPEPYFKSIYTFLESHIDGFDPSQLFILNSSTKDKLSLHINYKGIVFENCDHQKPFWQDAISFFEENDEHRHMGIIKKTTNDKFERKSVVDVQVYSKNRSMRAINCHKKDSDRVLVPVQWTDSEKLVQIPTSDYNTGDYFHGTTEKANFLYNPKYDHGTPNKPITLDMINKIIEDNIPNTKLGCRNGSLFMLENVGTRRCIMGGEENTSDNCYIIWKKSGLYFGCHDANCYGKQIQLIKNDNKELMNEPDHLCPKHWASMDNDDYKGKMTYFQKYMAYISDLNCYCWKLDKFFKLGATDKASAAFIHFKVDFEDDDGDITSKSIFPIWNNMINKTTYARLEWFPWTLKKPKGGSTALNQFLGFNHLYVPNFKVDQNKINPWLFHLENVICNEDQTVFEYLVNWLAHVVQNPHQKTGVNIVVKSMLEGAGKDTFLDFFTEHVLGSEFAQSFNKIDELSKKFNKNAEKSLITLLSEVGGNGAAYKNHNTLKDITTRQYQNIEKKGIDGYRARDYNNYWMFSNDDWIVKINETDRRHLCISANTVYVGDEDYFNNLYNQANLSNGEHFFQYLCQRDISNFSLRKIPQTEWSRSMKYKNFDPKFKVIKHLYQTSEEECIKIHSDTLMGLVNANSKDSNQYTSIRSFNNDWILYTMKLWGETKRIRTGQNRTQKVGFIISKDIILQTAKKIQRDPNFTFDLYIDDDDEQPDVTECEL